MVQIPPGYDPDEAPDADAGIFGSPFTPAQAALVLIGVPWDVTTSYRPGAARAPEAIRAASHQLDLLDLETGQPWREGIALVSAPDEIRELARDARADAERVIAVGGRIEDDPDLATALGTVNAAGERLNVWVRAETDRWLDAGKQVGIVGGDHSTPFGALQALASRHDDFGVLHIDAHADLRRAYEGFTWSHASIMSNVLEHISSVSRLVQVGVRDLSAHERDRIEADERILTWYGPALFRYLHQGQPWQRLAEQIVEELPQRVYVSFDIDGLDPTYCPHTGTPVPGGLDFNQACTLLRVLGDSGREIVGFDLSEVAPGPGDDEWDANVGARVLYKLCGWMLRRL